MHTNEKRDAGAMKFDEVRVGDTVRTRAEFTDGTVIETEFTVTYVNSYAFGNAYTGIHASLDGRKSLSIELVSRPPKVGGPSDRRTGSVAPGPRCVPGFL